MFIATIQMGTRSSVSDAMIDNLLLLTITTQNELFRQHQAEEGVNLKALLEDCNHGGKMRISAESNYR